MSNFLKLTEGINVQPLLDKITPEMWGENTDRQTYDGTAHADTETIYLRWCKSRTIDAAFSEIEAEDIPHFLTSALADIVIAVLKSIGDAGQLGRVMIVKLKSGGKIKAHTDDGRYADHYDRFHVSLQSDAGNMFHVGGGAFHALPGECWWFNHKREHWVENNSSRDRIHLIIDVVSPEHRAMRGIYFQRERFADVYPQAERLLRMHYDEIAVHKDIQLEPFHEAYQAMEDAGMMVIFTARENGELVGYAAFIVSKMLHYKSHVQAVQDVLYIHPGLRGRTVGFRFIKYIDDQLTADGVSLIVHHVKVLHPALGKVLEKLGYAQIETVFQRRTRWEQLESQ